MPADPTSAPTKYMTPGEVARLFEVHVGTVGRWADEGRLPHIKTPAGSRRFLREDVEKFIKDQGTAA